MASEPPRLYFKLRTLLLFVTCLAALFGAARIGYERGYARGEAERRRQHVVTRVYEVSDLLRAARDRDNLATLLRENVDPGSWQTTGGRGTLHWLEGPPVELVILQSETAHDEITAYLDQLRRHLSSGSMRR